MSKFFLNTLDVSENVAWKALQKKNPVGFDVAQQQGLHKNRPHALGEVLSDTENHIKSFPKVDSHYCRKSSIRQYLSPLLSIQEMYRLFVTKQQLEGKDIVTSLNTYEQVFYLMNLSFHRPKKDLCTKCTGYRNAPVKTNEMKMEFQLHISEAKKVRDYTA